MYAAVREITHMLTVERPGSGSEVNPVTSAARVVLMIVFMNLIFSFASILSAIAMTDVFLTLATAIAVSGIAMPVLVDRVTEFLERNRMHEVLGLFILLIVGDVLIGEAGPEAGHAMHDESLRFRTLGHELLPVSKTTFHFFVAVLVAVEIVRTGYRRRLEAEKSIARGRSSAH